MNDNLLTDDTKAIILLCAVLGKSKDVQPLNQAEYTKIVKSLVKIKKRPAYLLKQENLAAMAASSGIDILRLEALLNRGVQLGFAVEEWQRNGIWIISRSDKEYPQRYRNHLKEKAPPLLFGAGDRSLLIGGGLAIVGSRNVDARGEAFTRHVAELCAYNRMPVVSGGARGVDQVAMNAALDAGGVTIGVIAENLLKKSLERTARKAISESRLLLVSPYHPNARFTVGTAMGRNKLIYAMADYGLVVSADYNKGGTWAGAKEELKRDNALPVFVRIDESCPKGNQELMALGAVKWPEINSKNDLNNQLSETKSLASKKVKDVDLFAYSNANRTPSWKPKQNEKLEPLLVKEKNEKFTDSTDNEIYDVVIPVILKHLETATKLEDLSKTLDVSKTQLATWLKKAMEEKIVIKQSQPVRYKAVKQVYP